MSDFDRNLLPRGSKDVKLVARELMALEYEPDMIISSPAIRAKQTSEIFAREFNYPSSQIKFLNYLYGYFSVNELIADIEKLAGKLGCVQIIGHNPTIPELGADLTGSAPEALPTTGTLVIEFDVNKWEYVSEASGVLTQVVFPSSLRE